MKLKSDTTKEIVAKEISESIHIPYMRHISEDIVQTNNGDLVLCIKLSGLTHETKSDDELDIEAKNRKELWNKFAGKPIQLYTHVIRKKVSVKSKAKFKEPFLTNLNEKYTAKFKNKSFFVNEIYLSIVRKNSNGFFNKENPLSKLFGKLKASKKASESSKSLDEIFEEFNEYKTVLKGSLSKYKPTVLGVKTIDGIDWSEPMAFFGYLINNQDIKYKLPDGPMNKYLPVNRKFFGWKKLAVSKKSERTSGVLLSIKNYCNSTFAGMIDNVVGLRTELVLTQSWEPISRNKAVDQVKTTSRRMMQGDNAVTLQKDLERDGGIIDLLSSGEQSLGTNHFSLFIFDKDEKRLDENIGEAQRELASLGINAETDNINIEAAFWAQLPGNKAYIARKGDITSFNFADFASFHNVPLGEKTNKWGEFIMILKSTIGSPLYFNWHYGDTGIVSVIGPSGSGKTVAMTMGIASTLKHDPQVYIFDKDQGAKIFVKAINGEYSSIKTGEDTGWNPLICENTESNKSFLKSHFAMILQDTTPLTASEKNKINDLVNMVFQLPEKQRRLRSLAPIIVSQLSSRYENYRRWITDEVTGSKGELAWVFDSEPNQVEVNKKIVGIDMTEFIENDEIRGPIFNYLFHQIVESLNGKPVAIVIDEGWIALDHPVFEERIEDWARTIRKNNGVLILGTQNPSDASKNKALVQQSKTDIFFPNPKARDEDYKEWNLTDREIKLIKDVIDPHSRYFLIRQPSGSVLGKLDLTGCEDEIAVLSGRKETVLLMDKLIAQYGEQAENWLPEFKKRWRHV